MANLVIKDKVLVRFHEPDMRMGRYYPPTKQPPAKAGGFELRTGSPDTRRLDDAS